MNDQNQSPLYLDWWVSVFDYRLVYFLPVVRRYPYMRSLFRTFSIGLICSLLIAPSGAAVNGYGYRSRRSLAAAQSSVVTVYPTSNTTPDPSQGGSAVTGASNTGHSSTQALSENGGFVDKSCRWFSFPTAP